MLNTPIISIVDDDDTVRVSLDSLVRSMGYAARTYSCAEEYLACYALDLTACLISDIRMPGMSGLQLFEELQARAMGFPVIFITASLDETPELKAREMGAVGYFKKPFKGEQLMQQVRDVLNIQTAG
ncbi:Response regulator protein TodT [Pseudomonas fluorescens]|uniref:Response regulator protein TodT n=1 Tax=Pseudomonas fluorescens TaxID=294 RepID=A0A5E6UMA8_PSEFL|nr:response regulator [Pseudomonas fluorescens]VVN02136.1 Response regulator protein TodT [Pseudomonas fluorescens]